MTFKNIETYVKTHSVCFRNKQYIESAQQGLWLFLEYKKGYRIFSHGWVDDHMFWDGSGIQPIQVGLYTTKKEVIEAIYNFIIEHEDYYTELENTFG